MAASSAECSTQPGDIWKQVNNFLQGALHSSSHVSFESLSSSALFLLRSIPVARHAVLEHYAMVFDEAVNTHLSALEMGSHGTMEVQESQLSALQDVTGVLLAFIKSNPEAWAPVVSSWSLSLLGQMSSKYATRRGIQHATNLNEVLQMWMACPPAKMLIEITTDCFAAMVGGAPDMCVDSLLEASVRFSPHFDWVVAHIGSCFPTTIITRVLNCGLKDFCTGSRGDGHDRDPATAGRMKIPKMASVVGILGHLAAKHSHDIRKALMDLFEASLLSPSPSSQQPPPSSSSSQHHQQVTTLPFLLQLASMSSMLLSILTTDLVAALTPSVLNKIHNQFTHWKRSSPSEYNSFLNLVVHLIGKSSSGALVIINFVLSTAIPTETSSDEEMPCEAVRDTCSEIMHILLFELQRGVMSIKVDGSIPEIPLLVGLAKQTDVLTSRLIHSQGDRFDSLLKLVTFTGLHATQDVAASMLAYVVINAGNPQQLSIFYKLKNGLEMGYPSVVKSALVQIFQKLGSSQHSIHSTIPSTSSSAAAAAATTTTTTTAASQSTTQPSASSTLSSSSSSSSPSSSSLSSIVLNTLKNLERIVSVEKKKLEKKCFAASLIMSSIGERHATLLEFALHDDPSVRSPALYLMSAVGFQKELDTALLTRLCGALVAALFSLLRQRSSSGSADKSSSREITLCMDCLQQLGYSPFTKSLLIHYLVEGAVDKSNSYLFGGRETTSSSSSSPPSALSISNQDSSSSLLTKSASLLAQNHAQNLSISLPRSHSSVYHGGVIQQNKKHNAASKPLSKRTVWENRQTLVDTLWECCKDVVYHHHQNYSQQQQQPSTTPPPPSDGSTTTVNNAKDVEEPMDTSSSNSPAPTPSTSRATPTPPPPPPSSSRSSTPTPNTGNNQHPHHYHGAMMSESAARTLGCVLVDVLTQDSLYNDVCWPDPEFRKVTTERDILVWKKLDELSFLWDIIQEFSFSCVFLYYLSPVLRSVTGTLMNTFEMVRDPRMRNRPKHYEVAIKMVACLGKGQLLPPPLHNISELFPFVSPYEGFLLLLAVWQFIKENPPSEFESEIKMRKCSESHTHLLASIIHGNIDTMGHLCPRILDSNWTLDQPA